MTTYGNNSSPLILVVDDDRFTRLMLRQVMEQEGYTVEEAEDGQQCLAAYQSHEPDMVLLDAMMPVMDGFICCSKLQALREGNCAPVLMITGLNDQASVDWAFESGAIDFVTKPVHPPVLRRRVRRLLEASWAQKALLNSEKQYRSVVENVREVIFETDADGQWTFLNTAWTNLTGFKVVESLGKNFLDYIHPQDQELHRELWRSLIEGQKGSIRQELRCLTKAEESRWIEIRAHAQLLINGSILGISGTLQDITERLYTEALEKEKVRLETEIVEREQRSEMMRAALDKEKELGELKSRVITTISHEFRTPLTTIQSSSELLENYADKLVQEKKRKHFQKIGKSVAHMTKLLEEVTLFDEAEAGQLVFNPIPLNLENLCLEIVEELQVDVDDQHTIALWSQGDNTKAIVDQKLLRQILTNLLSNGVKYSPQGGTVNLELICQDDQAIFRVEDHGIGIPSEDQPRIFESFYRAGNAGTIRGTGLGLAIVKKCVDLHQGRIKLESEVGIGTTFTLILPLNASSTSAF
ncbi:ATP-binding protein [Lyngbya aestuarii]|uniref:ATP-binding protein n=1 Tax=Lyngbya aestuarii TaxID=118322 RepID=UPI00403DC7FF